MQADDIALRQHFIKRRISSLHRCAPPLRAASSTRMPSTRPIFAVASPSSTIADNAQRRTVQFAYRIVEEAESTRLLPATTFHSLAIGQQIAAQGKDQRKHMLRYGMPCIVSDIRNNDDRAAHRPADQRCRCLWRRPQPSSDRGACAIASAVSLTLLVMTISASVMRDTQLVPV